MNKPCDPRLPWQDLYVRRKQAKKLKQQQEAIRAAASASARKSSTTSTSTTNSTDHSALRSTSAPQTPLHLETLTSAKSFRNALNSRSLRERLTAAAVAATATGLSGGDEPEVVPAAAELWGDAEAVAGLSSADQGLKVIHVLGALCRGPHRELQRHMYHPGHRGQTGDVLGVLVDLLAALDAHFGGAIASDYGQPLCIAREAFATLAAIVRGNADAAQVARSPVPALSSPCVEQASLLLCQKGGMGAWNALSPVLQRSDPWHWEADPQLWGVLARQASFFFYHSPPVPVFAPPPPPSPNYLPSRRQG